MIVADVMTRHVLSVAPESTVEEAAATMLERGFSGLFVVDAKGDLVGVVTEGDLLRRDEIGTQRHRPWWLRLLVSPGRQAADFTRTHGRRVSDVMTESVISVPHDAELETVVDLMERNRIKRVPVTQDGRVVGVVSRADLLRALVTRARKEAPVSADDRTVRAAILDGLDKQSWAPMTTLNVTVVDGVVDVWGTITNDDERRAICVIAENTPGVKSVRDHLVFVEPYSGTVIEAPDDKA
ncbi:MAG: CBS domain-containing protein [Rhodospirillales bacterium]|nr:CBS domain-containing protein [Rhodospirillales bacterium]MBN8897820.1 CBS domain-containing protein [Rhodospirillales bacterium]